MVTVGSLSPRCGVGCLDLIRFALRFCLLASLLDCHVFALFTLTTFLLPAVVRALLVVGSLSSSSVSGSVDAGDRVASSEPVSSDV